jgi:hypothetical protein
MALSRTTSRLSNRGVVAPEESSVINAAYAFRGVSRVRMISVAE